MTNNASAASGTLTASFIQQLSSASNADPEIARRSNAAHLTFALRDTASGDAAWVRIDDATVSGGTGEADSRFALEGDGNAWHALIGGLPINRLVRQGKIKITGDARSCLQNWLLVYAVLAAASKSAGV